MSEIAKEADRLHEEQVKLLYLHSKFGVIATAINGFLLTLSLWAVIPHSRLLAWLACTESLVALRWLLLGWYTSLTQNPRRIHHTWIGFLIGTLLSGFCWGSAGFFLFAEGSLAHQTFLAFVLGGMTAGAVTIFAPKMETLLAFIVPALLPITLRFLAEGSEIQRAMGIMTFFCLTMMLVIGQRVHLTLVKSLRLQLENSDLVCHLTNETQRMEKLNDELQREVGERQRIHEELRSAHSGLESEVRRRTAELSEANLKLIEQIQQRQQLETQLLHSQKMEAIGRLAGGVAHDFNNLLTAIIGYSQLALTRLATSDPSRQAVEEIEKASQRAASLTNQLLAFSRKQILQPVVLDLNELVGNMQKMLHRLIGEDIHLVTVPKPGLWRVRADPGQIEQVIMNLVVNARDAMPHGGTLTIELENVELAEGKAREHTDLVQGSYVMLLVKDSGCGMDRETMAHIFEPFFTTKERGKGTGLGLSMAYGIIKQSNGDIWVDSDPGRSTTFRVYLPRVNEWIESLQPEDDAQPQAGCETILLVEDEEAIRKLAGEVLRKHGYTVLEAISGEEALSIARNYPDEVHLLLTDVVMPGMDGKILADSLTPQRPAMKVIYMSGYTDDAILDPRLLAPGVAFLQKPFTLNVLTRKVHEVLKLEPNGVRLAQGNKRHYA
jgi:signal transduction histidine kinase/ActR/RegA family two-component response regulator